MRASILLLILLCPAVWAESDFSATGEKISAALEGSIRTDAERARDRNRKPVQTLEFFRLRDDMKVLELVPGGGWYTKVLAPVLAERGELYLAIGAERLEERLLNQPGFERVKVIRGANPRTAPLDFEAQDFDLVLTFRNLHNYDEAARRNLNAATFAALKPGGHYGVVDHTRRHMEPDAPSNRRRMDPVRMIHEIESEGFEFVDFATLHYRADDELRYEVGVRSVTGNTDRFTLLFRKPK